MYCGADEGGGGSGIEGGVGLVIVSASLFSRLVGTGELTWFTGHTGAFMCTMASSPASFSLIAMTGSADRRRPEVTMASFYTAICSTVHNYSCLRRQYPVRGNPDVVALR